MRWFPAFPLDSLNPGSARVVKPDGLQIAVFRLDDGEVRALDNRCPHEGYPLSQGVVCGRVLTCSWHNYKFNLDDGACVLGEEAVRSWPVRIEAGTVEIDLSPPDPEQLRQTLRESLHLALHKNEPGRAIRDLHRLLATGVSPEMLAVELAAYDAAVGEYGNHHGPAVAADLITLLPTLAEPLVALAQLVDVVAEPNQRLSRRAEVAAAPVGEDPGAELIRRVEAEDLAGAEALLRGMIAAGWTWRGSAGAGALEPLFLEMSSAHFLDFGHPLIYTSKFATLLDHHDTPSVKTDLLVGLLTNIVYGTREDLLPAWAGVRSRVSAWSPEVIRAARDKTEPAAVDAMAALETAILAASPGGALDHVYAALPELGLHPVLRVLERAAAERLLRFDPAWDRSPDTQDSWLSVSHVLTFARAVATVAPRSSDLQLLRLIAQATRFIAAARPLDGPATVFSPDHHVETAEGISAMIAAIRAQTPSLALAAAAGLPPRAIRDSLITLVLADETATRPIFLAHHLKTTLAAYESAEIGGDLRGLLAVVRWLCLPGRERGLFRRAREAAAFLDHGRTPKVVGP